MLFRITCLMLLATNALFAQNNFPCQENTKEYTSSGGFVPADFAASGATGGLDIGNTVTADPGGRIDTQNIVFPKTQPFVADYLGEGAGASHLFGFFFLDIDSSGNGIPNFFMIGDFDDLDGDGIANFEDNDDDGDGILDINDKAGYNDTTGDDAGFAPSLAQSMPATFFRNGVAAAAAGEHPDDYWQFVPNGTHTYTDDEGREFQNFYRHPGAYLYVDQYDRNGSNTSDGVPDAMQLRRGFNRVPQMVLDQNWTTQYVNSNNDAPGLLGQWGPNWVGSTIFYLADDDGGTGITGHYTNNTPYRDNSGIIYRDLYSGNNQPDYDIYGTTDTTSPNIPALVNRKDPEGQDYWRYRWYQSDISGGRELCFFMVVFWGSGGQSVNTYYSKVSLNQDNVGNPNPGGGNHSDGDNYGVRTPDDAVGTLTPNNWWPRFQNDSDHNRVAAVAFGDGTQWTDIATNPKDGTAPVAHDEENQAWVDEFNNYDPQRRIIAYRSLNTWLNTAGAAEARIRGRYDIDLDAEQESVIVRAIDGQMNHLLVGAPEANENAWLLGWEDLFGGGDRDYEDIVWYVSREASGSLETNNIASDLAPFEDVSLTSVTFEFTDNFTDNRFEAGTPRNTYVNYYYKLDALAEWIPLMGGEHERTPDLFATDGTIEVTGSQVTRKITIQVPPSNAGTRELYWRVDMSTGDESFTPEMFNAVTSYEALIHDYYYETAVIPSSNVDYYGAYETPSIFWADQNANRGHFYALKTFEHAVEPERIPITLGENPETADDYADPLPRPFLWDAGISMYNQVEADNSNRKIYTWLDSGSGPTKKELTLTSLVEDAIQDAFALDDPSDVGSTVIDGLLANNFHDTSATPLQKEEASAWLVAYLHGYNGGLLDASDVVIPNSKKEWVLGGVKRSSATILRSPGIPTWFTAVSESRDDFTNIQRDYLEWAIDRQDTPTRVLFGSESGMVHAINAGNWRPDRLSPEFLPVDGHYEGDDVGIYDASVFGDGKEVWAMVPHNLLDDLKYNVTGLEPSGSRAVVDTTGVLANIYDPSSSPKWRRVAVFSQGEVGGVDGGRKGSYVFALDVSFDKDVNGFNDNVEPLWEYTQDNFQELINPAAVGWFQESTNQDSGWRVVMGSGASGVVTERPTMVFLDALTGQKVDEYDFGSGAGETMASSPALLDFDNDGLIDFAYAGTSDGKIVAYHVQSRNAITFSVPNGRFFLSPNVRTLDSTRVRVIFVSGDNPLRNDEDSTNFPPRILVMEHEIPDFDGGQYGTLSIVDTFNLDSNQKVFARPRLIGENLVVGTTSGDTINLCDFDPTDPGDLLIFTDVANISDTDLLLSEEGFGSIKAPIVISGNEIRAHQFLVTSGDEKDESRAPWRYRKTKDTKISRKEPTRFNTGRLLGISGWQERDQ